MEITTLIKWNSIIYVLYYSLNLAIDYYCNRGNKPQGVINYSLKELLDETPQTIENPEVETPKSAEALATQQITETMDTEKVTYNAPIEDQGIPFEEFMNNARGESSNINF